MIELEANRRTRKRRATRQKISDAATRLFIKRGFDHVRIDDIAEAADVSRMTVFNHFARKEDMFFDLNEESQQDLLAALEKRDPDLSPVEAVRRFAHWAVAQQRPYVRFFHPESNRFMATIEASETLRARARSIQDEITETLADALARSAKRTAVEVSDRLAASLLVATWRVAIVESHRDFKRHQDVAAAYGVFLTLIDQGSAAVHAVFEEKRVLSAKLR